MTRALALSAAILAATAAYLLAIGRPFLGPSRTVRLWVGDPQDPEGSQHLLDWWSLSHVIHGFLSSPSSGWSRAASPWAGASSSPR